MDDTPRCICGPDSTGEEPDIRPDCPAHNPPTATTEDPWHG